MIAAAIAPAIAPIVGGWLFVHAGWHAVFWFLAAIGLVLWATVWRWLPESLDPAQQLVGIVHHELVDLMGPVDHSLHLQSGTTTILMLCGLQGSGKTTSCAKLAKKILGQGRGVMLVAADLQRPAAIEQLAVLGLRAGQQNGNLAREPPRVLFCAPLPG